MFLRSNYSVIFNTMAYDIVLGSLFSHKIYANPDSDWALHCHSQNVVSSIATSGLHFTHALLCNYWHTTENSEILKVSRVEL